MWSQSLTSRCARYNTHYSAGKVLHLLFFLLIVSLEVENCARFPREIIRSIRSVVGADVPILFRISLDHRFEGGRTIEDSLKLLKLLEEEGVDAFDIDAGCYETLDYIFPPSYLGISSTVIA